MSTLRRDTGIRAAGGGIGVALLAAIGIRRLGIEFERAWLESLSAPPEPFELELFASLLQSDVQPHAASGRENGHAPGPHLADQAPAARRRNDQPYFRPRADLRASPRRPVVR